MTTISDHSADESRRHRVTARLASFAGLDEAEIAQLAAMAGPVRMFKRGELIRGEAEVTTHLHLLVEGWAASAITLANGCRQLTMVSLPGDMLGLPSLAVLEPIDGVVALSTAVVVDIPIANFARLFTQSPRLAALVFLVSQEERVFAMERLALLGQAKAPARLAALLLRLSERIAQLEGETTNRFPLPLTQQDIGDLIGVSSVHTNTLIKELRAARIATVAGRHLEIHDRAALVSAAGVTRWRQSAPTWLPQSVPVATTTN